MKLYEWEGKSIFNRKGINVPKSMIITSEADLEKIQNEFDFPIIIKAQVLQGGRGKRGLIKEVNDLSTAYELVANMLHNNIDGELVSQVLVEEKIAYIQEAYAGITFDDITGKLLLVISTTGGIEVEELATIDKSNVLKTSIEPLRGLRFYDAISYLKSIGFKGKSLVEFAKLLVAIYQLFIELEAEIIEVNPVFLTQDQSVIAGDSKIVIDPNSSNRNTYLKKRSGSKLQFVEDEYEKRALELGFTFVNLKGNIAIVSAGAGFTMSLLDSISHLGGKPANFADMSGGASVDALKNMKELVKLVFQKADSDEQVKVILFAFTLSATPIHIVCDLFIDVLEDSKPSVPIIGSISASGASTSKMSMNEASVKLEQVGVIYCHSLKSAIQKAVNIAEGRENVGNFNK
jgi:succinyl-CoA synthetase beta subunit